jgi:hypothetical protein
VALGRSSSTFEKMVSAVTDTETAPVFSGLLDRRARLLSGLREALLFPGCVVALSGVLVVDAAIAMARGLFVPALTQAYLVLFLVAGLAAKARRTRMSMQQLAEVRRD